MSYKLSRTDINTLMMTWKHRGGKVKRLPPGQAQGSHPEDNFGIHSKYLGNGCYMAPKLRGGTIDTEGDNR